MKLIEQLFGRGDVSENGTQLGKVNYQLCVYQKFVEGEEGLKSIDGRIDSEDLLRFFGRENLILTLEDGRSIKFFVLNINGEIQCRGGFFNKES